MYTPVHYKTDDKELIFDIINNYGFATLITIEDHKPFISHLPLLLESTEDKPRLLGHCARANPHWKHFAAGQSITAIFHGPHSYISPAWYVPKPDNVPTWNYATVHIQGKAKILSDRAQVFSVLSQTVKKFEDNYQTGWTLPSESNPELEALLNAIVAFEIEIVEVTAKLKLSQKQEVVNRQNVIQELSQFDEAGQALAEYIKRTAAQS